MSIEHDCPDMDAILERIIKTPEAEGFHMLPGLDRTKTLAKKVWKRIYSFMPYADLQAAYKARGFNPGRKPRAMLEKALVSAQAYDAGVRWSRCISTGRCRVSQK